MVKIKFDESYWPKCGTMVSQIPHDLNDLWETHPDQAGVFVAEALINENSAAMVEIDNDGPPTIWVPLWSIGGDTLVIEADLCKEIIDAARFSYSRERQPVRSQAQRDEAIEYLGKLKKIKDAAIRGMEIIEEAVSDFDRK